MKHILPTIVVSQFLCTSVWFASNAVMPDIISIHHLEETFLAHLTSAVQLGFILGTLIFALFTVSDRFSPSKVFFICSLIAAGFNLAVALDTVPPGGLLSLRFFTGFFLAGIYPVGMKIASDYYQQGLGKSLGFLVGALVLGTAFPHLLKSVSADLPWKNVMYATSGLSVVGGLAMIALVPDGPFLKPGQQLRLNEFLSGFRLKQFRAAALGYFGHMWELYAFWAFVPVILTAYKTAHPEIELNVPFLSFLIIASGGLACVIGGLLSQKFNTKLVATVALLSSCVCCLVSPLFLSAPTAGILVVFLLFWGMVVVADSPLFSSLVARNAPAQSRGTSLTIVNCIGFAITVVSIQAINVLSGWINPQYLYMALAAGPVLGLVALIRSSD